MKKIFLILLSLQAFVCFSQKKFDKKIVIGLTDSMGIYEKVRIALVNNEFIVKDNRNKDTLTTYVRELGGIGYVLVKAVISGSSVKIFGVYGSKKINEWGYTATPKNYQDIIYYKGSKTWKILRKIADDISGEITFSE
jgi:hypothetical protein